MRQKEQLKIKIEKIVVNTGLGRLSQNQNFEDKLLPEIIKEISLVTGQKPAAQKAKQPIAGFKIRAGQIIGLKMTLRRKRAADFCNRLIKVVLPRVRDFRGINLQNIDQRGNLNIGFKDCLVFPEINPETLKMDFGLETTIVTNAKTREEAIEFYRKIGVPLKFIKSEARNPKSETNPK